MRATQLTFTLNLQGHRDPIWMAHTRWAMTVWV